MRHPHDALLILLIFARTTSAQVCPANVQNVDQNATLSVTNAGETCTVPDGGYVKVGTQIKRHIAASVSGTCQTFAWNGSSCVPQFLFNRTAVASATYINGASGSTIWGNSNVQYYMTCGNGNCSPVNTVFDGPTYTPTSTGAYVYTANNVSGGGTIGSGSQYCNMSGPYESDNTITMWALQCEPQWKTDDNNNIARLDTSDTVTIYLPSAMTSFALTPLTAAVTDWETRTGFDFEIVTDAPCSGSQCINIELELLTGCGYTPAFTSDSAGVRTGTQTIQIASNYSFSDQGMQRTLAHELGHLMGLDDNDCGVSDSLMEDDFYCNDTGVVDDVTINDWTPVNNTVYGNGSRLSCGF